MEYTTMAAATHKGTCQICGSVQKLPNGKIAKHGYSVKYSMFIGTCKGSGGLPLEVSNDLIIKSIAIANEMIQGLQANIQSLVSGEKAAYIHIDGKNRQAIMADWSVENGDEGYQVKQSWVGYTMKPAHFRKVTNKETNNESPIRFFEGQISELNSFIASQETKLAEWSQQELKSI